MLEGPEGLRLDKLHLEVAMARGKTTCGRGPSKATGKSFCAPDKTDEGEKSTTEHADGFTLLVHRLQAVHSGFCGPQLQGTAAHSVDWDPTPLSMPSSYAPQLLIGGQLRLPVRNSGTDSFHANQCQCARKRWHWKSALLPAPGPEWPTRSRTCNWDHLVE